MMKISDINEIMEKHILPSLKTLRDSDMLPRKKDPTNPNAYKFESLIMKNSNLEGFHYQKMIYDESAFEKPPNIDDFVMAFEAYYMLVNELKTVNGTQQTNENQARVMIPRKNARVIAYLNIPHKFMYFAHKTGDDFAEIMISAYIKEYIRC